MATKKIDVLVTEIQCSDCGEKSTMEPTNLRRYIVQEEQTNPETGVTTPRVMGWTANGEVLPDGWVETKRTVGGQDAVITTSIMCPTCAAGAAH